MADITMTVSTSGGHKTKKPKRYNNHQVIAKNPFREFSVRSLRKTIFGPLPVLKESDSEEELAILDDV